MTSLVDKAILHLNTVVRRIRRNVFSLVVQDSWGPIARDMDTIVPVVKALLDGVTINKMDPLTVPYPFNEKVGKYHSSFSN